MVASATGGPEVRGRRISPRPRRRGPRMGETGIVGVWMMVRVWGVGATERRWAWIAVGEVCVRRGDPTVIHRFANVVLHL
jgi:hypothetical protein